MIALMPHKTIILIFSLLLLSIPILQAGHLLAHFEVSQVETIINSLDEIDDGINHHCFDCLVLKALGPFLLFLSFLFSQKFTSQPLPGYINKLDYYNVTSVYHTRGPPLILKLYQYFDHVALIQR
jgi:hypothetical protein